MASTSSSQDVSAVQRPQHRRNKSASVLKSIMPSKTAKHSRQKEADTTAAPYGLSDQSGGFLLPADHPHAGQRVLGEIRNLSSGGTSPSKPRTEDRPSLYRSSKSGEPGIPSQREKVKDGRRLPKEDGSPAKPKKTKSSTNLANIFGMNKSQKDLTLSPSKPSKDKENTTPPSSSHAEAASVPPIWAQFATQKPPELYQEQSSTSTVPLNDEKEKLREIIRYNPMAYTESKQKDFSNIGQPTLGAKRSQRPKSLEVAAASAKNLFQPLNRKASNGKSSSRKASDEQRGREKKELDGKGSKPNSLTKHSQTASPTKKSKVSAVVATINDKAKDAELESLIRSKDLDSLFEAVLDSRNIPEPMREKMRTLTPRLKADFIRSNGLDGRQSPASKNEGDTTAETSRSKDADSKKTSRSKHSTRSRHEDAVDDDETAEGDPTTPKRSRPRSRAFTFSKGDLSPSKKMKGDLEGTLHKREKSRDIHKSTSSTNLVAAGKSDGSTKAQKGSKTTSTREYVKYLHDTTDNQQVEVGRLHKLRILLRNETVGWVDAFITEGGMTEIIALLHRIMDVEWRDEHEDALLHEALLCLKGILTTALALQKLCEVEDTLFPALLSMLFSKDRKGPSEYTTRTIIINILFMHLSAAVADPVELNARAKRVMTYLEDPVPPEEKRTHAWITDMQQRRPYKIWCKELTNISKEVFWIFLHHLNIISLPSKSSAVEPKAVEGTPPPLSADKPLPPTPGPTTTTSRPTTSAGQGETFVQRHFPPLSRPPVPAAPYVGGVEWDATNYVSAHLDLLNALIASLPCRTERNELRALLRLSDFEKVLSTLRTCKEKFYAAVHCGLRTWVAAGGEDDWDVKDVRFGVKEEVPRSPAKGSPVKGKGKKDDAAPKLDLGMPFELGDKIGGGLGKPGDAKWEYDDFGTKKR